MTCHDMEKRLHDLIDGLLPDEERHTVENHLETCATCREEALRIRHLLDRVKTLPTHIAPARDLWPDINARLETLSVQRKPAVPVHAGNNGVLSERVERIHRPETRKARRALWLGGALATVFAGMIVIRMMTFAPDTGWALIPLEGAPKVDGVPVDRAGAIRVGGLVETDAAARVKISDGSVGYIDIEPNSRVRLVEAREIEHRLSLDRGTLHAMIWAPPRLFFVETPSAVAVDLGCAYKLTVDEQDHGLLHVTAGWVELDYKGRKSTVPAGMLCETRPGVGPGTPFSEDAPPTLRRALVRFDFEQGGQEALVEALAGARPQDGVMLRHLLKRVDQEARGMVFDRMAELGLTPDGASTADDMRGDENMERVEKPLESETP